MTTQTPLQDSENQGGPASLIVFNGQITSLSSAGTVSAMACRGESVMALGNDREIMQLQGPDTLIIDARKKRVIPGLNDSHLHIVRGGLNYNLELRWDGVPSLADALRMLAEQAQRTPPGHWVRVVGGWTEFQFRERRLPTLEELNRAAPDTPVFVLHLYDRALLNRAAVLAAGYDEKTPDPPGGFIQRDKKGRPTGLLIAKPNAFILYSTLAKGPKLNPEQQANSTRHFLREMNRLGLTSCADAGGGFQRYPDDYGIIEQLHREGLLTVRIAYNLFTQKAKEELSDFTNWTKMIRPRQGDRFLRHNGAGEMLVFSAADFEDFLEPRPELPAIMEAELEAVIRHLAANRWPFRLHATYNETISRALDVYERVNREIPLEGLNWFFDHAETIDSRNIERIRAMGGGIAIQHRMAYQGEYFVNRYGGKTAKVTPPIREMLKQGVPVGAGTDATRVASYNPWVSLYWLVTGRTVGGLQLYDQSNRLDRMEALRLWTKGSSWFSKEDDVKGELGPGKLADFTILSRDYFAVPEEEIKSIESLLTVVGGRPVYGAEDFASLSGPVPPVMPDWSPVKHYGGYWKPAKELNQAVQFCEHGHAHTGLRVQPEEGSNPWDLGCACFAI